MSDDVPEPGFRVAEVGSLPWPDSPFKCRWTSEQSASGLPFGEFVRSLTPDQVHECPYHVGAD